MQADPLASIATKLKEEISCLFVAAAGTTVDEFYDGVGVGNLEAMMSALLSVSGFDKDESGKIVLLPCVGKT